MSVEKRYLLSPKPQRGGMYIDSTNSIDIYLPICYNDVKQKYIIIEVINL